MFNRLLIAFVVLSTAAATPALADNLFYYAGTPGTYITQGRSRTMSPAGTGATFSGFRYGQLGSYTNAVSVSVYDSVDSWTMYFAGPDLTLPTVGNYPRAERWPFQSPGVAGLDFYGNGRGNNTLTGNFQVLQADFNTNGQLVSFAANFTVYEEGATSRRDTGAIRYNSPIPVPEPSVAGLLAMAAVPLLRRRQRR